MTFDLIAFLVILVIWTAAYYLVIRHWLMQYALIAGVLTRIQTIENDWLAKIGIWLEAKKALLVAFILSMFGAAKSTVATSVGTLQQSDIDALKDQSIWHGLFNDPGIEMKIMAVLAFVSALFAVHGHLKAAKIVPQTQDAVDPTKAAS